MKKIFSMLTLLLFGLATFTQVSAGTFQDTTKKTKSGKLNRRYNANKHLKKDGTMDMRYKSSKNASKKVEAEKKKPVKP
ncbi:hypothetical protein DYU05_06125 [Mucilaginibacter terrenus]|uniref:Uncharacterized protein n=1 Tax=Mucilaginibacter terrenus TaxID=2482727 RepID=A0A3E2NVY5_9SPHI|nr:hypothetical protein [Mucilaginibacter terrenus]RFZ85175.1 hypothetical protein DYU05_06125 [Mucilaginibacter terrenus]